VEGLVKVSGPAGVDADDRPAAIMAGTGTVAAWVSSDRTTMQLIYLEGDSMDPTGSDVVDVPLPDISGGLRDPVLLRSDRRPGSPLVYLLFAGNPGASTATDVFALSIDLDLVNTSSPEDAFGAPLGISESPTQASIEVAGTWFDGTGGDVIAVVWNDRRSGGSEVYFRRIADLVAGAATSGVLASDEMNLSLGETGSVPGQGPTVVARGLGDEFTVVWWQGQVGSTETGDLYMRHVTIE
jgi:hypothetical protein